MEKQYFEWKTVHLFADYIKPGKKTNWNLLIFYRPFFGLATKNTCGMDFPTNLKKMYITLELYDIKIYNITFLLSIEKGNSAYFKDIRNKAIQYKSLSSNFFMKIFEQRNEWGFLF